MKNIKKTKKKFNLKKKIKLDDFEKSTSQQINKKKESYCCFQTTSCCLIRAVHIMLSSCNHDYEHIMINYVDNCFDSIVYQTS